MEIREEGFKGKGKLYDAEGEQLICDVEFIIEVHKTADGSKDIKGILHDIRHKPLLTPPGQGFVLRFPIDMSCDITISQLLAAGTGRPYSCQFIVDRIDENPRNEETQSTAP